MSFTLARWSTLVITCVTCSCRLSAKILGILYFDLEDKIKLQAILPVGTYLEMY